MMTGAQALTVLKALMSILPLVIAAVREGRIKADAMDDVIAELMIIHSKRVADAKKAAKETWEKPSWKR